MTENRNVQVPAEFVRRETVSLHAWLGSKVFVGRLDREVEAGARAHVDTALALHVARLTSTREREQIARAFRLHVRDADQPCRGSSSRVMADRAGVLAARDLIEEVILRLLSPHPVRARGMARLRLLLSDGAGPLYTRWRGSLDAELRGALAAL
jgi:hypothetical protein